MLRYRPIDIENNLDLNYLVSWYSDPSIRHFCFPHGDAASYRRKISADRLRERFETKLRGQYAFHIVSWQGKIIGEFSVEIGGGQLKKHRPKSAWVGVVIGEESARGRGLGQRIMAKVEAVARDMGAQRIELSVFEFNHNAIALYSKLGYQTFAKKPRDTYWRGRYWQSICMEKRLELLH